MIRLNNFKNDDNREEYIQWILVLKLSNLKWSSLSTLVPKSRQSILMRESTMHRSYWVRFPNFLKKKESDLSVLDRMLASYLNKTGKDRLARALKCNKDFQPLAVFIRFK